MLVVGDSPIVVETDGDITFKETVHKGSKGLWEVLSRKKVNKEFVTNEDLKIYKKNLTTTNAHLTRYQPHGYLKIPKKKKFVMLFRPSLRNIRDAVSKKHYVVSGQNTNGYLYQIILRPRQTVRVLELAEPSGGCGGGIESYTTNCRHYPGVVRETGCLYATQTCDEAFRL